MEKLACSKLSHYVLQRVNNKGADQTAQAGLCLYCGVCLGNKVTNQPVQSDQLLCYSLSCNKAYNKMTTVQNFHLGRFIVRYTVGNFVIL